MQDTCLPMHNLLRSVAIFEWLKKILLELLAWLTHKIHCNICSFQPPLFCNIQCFLGESHWQVRNVSPSSIH